MKDALTVSDNLGRVNILFSQNMKEKKKDINIKNWLLVKIGSICIQKRANEPGKKCKILFEHWELLNDDSDVVWNHNGHFSYTILSG